MSWREWLVASAGGLLALYASYVGWGLGALVAVALIVGAWYHAAKRETG